MYFPWVVRRWSWLAPVLPPTLVMRTKIVAGLTAGRVKGKIERSPAGWNRSVQQWVPVIASAAKQSRSRSGRSGRNGSGGGSPGGFLPAAGRFGHDAPKIPQESRSPGRPLHQHAAAIRRIDLAAGEVQFT